MRKAIVITLIILATHTLVIAEQLLRKSITSQSDYELGKVECLDLKEVPGSIILTEALWDYIYWPTAMPENYPGGAWIKTYEDLSIYALDSPEEYPNLPVDVHGDLVDGSLELYVAQSPYPNIVAIPYIDYSRTAKEDVRIASTEFTYEVRMKNISGGLAETYFMTNYDGGSCAVDVYQNEVRISCYDFSTLLYSLKEISVSNGEYNIFRVSRDTDSIKVYLNGSLIEEKPITPGYGTSNALVDFSGWASTYLGDPQLHISYWSHVSYTRGCWAPDQFPSPISGLSKQYYTRGVFESAPIDAGAVATWKNIGWIGTQPENTQVMLFTRTGNTLTPDDTWSNWSSDYNVPAGSSATIASQGNRFLQVMAKMQSADSIYSPIIDEINIYYSVSDSTRPAVITDLKVKDWTEDNPSISANSITLEWTAPADSAGYNVYYAPYSFSDENLYNVSVDTITATAANGEKEEHTVKNLLQGTSYYFAVKARSSSENLSELSNIVNEWTFLDVPYFCQGGQPWGTQWAYDFYLGGNNYMKDVGCSLTSLAMIINYYADHHPNPAMRDRINARIVELGGITPRTLNKYLVDKGWYDDVNHNFVFDIVYKITNGAVVYRGPLEAMHDTVLKDSLENKRPELLRLNNPLTGNAHSVVVKGIFENPGYIINDPGVADNNTLQRYNNTYFGIRLFQEWDGSPEPAYITFKGYKK